MKASTPVINTSTVAEQIAVVINNDDELKMNQTSHDQPLPKISILILAGGRAMRMQGMDKGLVHLHGQTLVQRIYSQAASLSDDVLISANRNQQTYQQLLPDCRIINDEWPDFRGPLAGIYSGLKHLKHAYLWVIPCDLMMLPNQCLQDLWQSLNSTDSQIAYASLNGRALYPLCLLYNDLGTLADSVYNELNQQHFAVHHWFSKHNSVMVDFTIQHDLPLNLNNLHDVELVERCYNITSTSNTILSNTILSNTVPSPDQV